MNLRHLLMGSLAMLAGAAACGRPPDTSAPRTGEASGAPIRIEATEVQVSGEAGDMEVPGAIESRRRAILSSRLSASIVEFGRREGESVKAGETLARLNADALSAAVSAAAARDEAATRDLKRAEALLAKGAATRNEVENATTAAAGAHAALTSARETFSYATIRAPFAGRIVKKLASAGDTVNPGTPLLELEGEGGLEVVASVEGDVHERLSTGQELRVRVDGIDEPVRAIVHALASSADPATHRFTLRADVRATPGLRAGLFARIAVPFPGAEQRLLVPQSAILRRGGLTGVYVIRDGRAWLRWIAPGDPFGTSLEARAGLEAGERVALDPERLYDGAPVTGAGR